MSGWWLVLAVILFVVSPLVAVVIGRMIRQGDR